MSSPIFSGRNYKKIEVRIKTCLNNQKNFLSERTADSPRAVGDAIQDIISENFKNILGSMVKDYSSSFARRAMADLAFTDKDNFYHVVDVKTHRLDTKFNMPNLTSVERLSRFYEDDRNYFLILKVDYAVRKTQLIVKHVTFVPIEFFSWNCLTIGALGWGQIQIANANKVTLNPKNRRKGWMIELCDTLDVFYPKEIEKISERIGYFRKVRSFWESKKKQK